MTAGRVFRRLYVFGDSFSDTGAGSPIDTGPTAVAFMAEALGINLQPARVGLIGPDSSVNFAAGGARSGFVMGMEIGLRRFGHGLVNQVSDFVGAVEEGVLQFKPDEALAFVAIGLNDAGFPEEESLTNILGSISRLVAIGVQAISLACLPEAIPAFCETSRRLNPIILKAVETAAVAHPGASIFLSDWGRLFDDVLEHWQDYGFVEPSVPCASGEIWFDRQLDLAGDPETYCYVTPGHPSVAVHRIVGARLAAHLVSPGLGSTS